MDIDLSFLYGQEISPSSSDPDKFVRPGSYLTESMLKNFYKAIMERAYMAAGAGGFENSVQIGLSRLDRFGTLLIPPNMEQTGLVFMTRPRLNLSDSNLRQNNLLMTLDTADIDTGAHNTLSISFMIRCLLDTYFTERNFVYAMRSPIVDPFNPFMTPMCNCLTEISGFPDFTVEAETTEGGFHSEDFTFAKGSDMLNHGGELSLTFKDTQGGIIMSLLYLWELYVALQCKGQVIAYEDDIYEQRLNYTVSIYRFLLDPSKRYITKWAKATGCFPKNVPIGACFNMSKSDVTVQASQSFTVQFAYNKVEYMDFAILKDFNRLMARYVGGIDGGGMYRVPIDTTYNCVGYPFVVSGNRGLELEYRAFPEEIQVLRAKDTLTESVTALAQVQAQEKKNAESLLLPDETVAPTLDKQTTSDLEPVG